MKKDYRKLTVKSFRDPGPSADYVEVRFVELGLVFALNKKILKGMDKESLSKGETVYIARKKGGDVSDAGLWGLSAEGDIEWRSDDPNDEDEHFVGELGSKKK
jgi:hypothetical protein